MTGGRSLRERFPEIAATHPVDPDIDAVDNERGGTLSYTITIEPHGPMTRGDGFKAWRSAKITLRDGSVVWRSVIVKDADEDA